MMTGFSMAAARSQRVRGYAADRHMRMIQAPVTMTVQGTIVPSSARSLPAGAVGNRLAASGATKRRDASPPRGVLLT
jgi:hypothetical protein